MASIHVLFAALLLAVAAPLASAQPEPGSRPKTKQTSKPSKPKKGEKPSLAEEGRALFPEATADSAAPVVDPDWRIVLATVSGPDADALAQQALWKVQNVGQLPEAYLHAQPTPARKEGAKSTEPPTKTWLVCYGRYPSADDQFARADLARIRAIEIAGQRPYSGAILLPPDEHEHAITSMNDLRSVRTRRTEEHLYTLAIGIYTNAEADKIKPEEMKEYRALAEEAAAKLRREGDEAYFYHGPNGSQVTIGVFTLDDFNPIGKPGQESPGLIAARQKFPHYLLNGKGQARTIKNSKNWRWELVPSTLVEIPK